MANNLIFPIGFDLESGVQDAIKRGDVALRQIQAAMNRKPIVLRAEVDASKFQMFSRQFTNSIDGISAKLAQAQRIRKWELPWMPIFGSSTSVALPQ